MSVKSSPVHRSSSMARSPYCDRGPQCNDDNKKNNGIPLVSNWEDVICPICLDFPHNTVLLQCSCFENGCRAFVCDTNHMHSNCLDRFKTACGITPSSPQTEAEPEPDEKPNKPSCPLCRGEVTGWVAVNEAREYLDAKNRCCDEEGCRFSGTYSELQNHAQKEHPHARPSKIDPARQLDWDNFQQSSEIIDVLSTIHSEVPRGVVLGDYVIEYGDDDTGDEFEDFGGGEEGGWWTSCILYQVFDNLRSSRNRRRSRRVGDDATRRGSRRSSYDNSNSDEGSVTSVEFAEYRVDETDDEFATAPSAQTRSGSNHRSSRRRRSRFYDS